MKRRTRILSILLTFAMLLSLLPTTAMAAGGQTLTLPVIEEGDEAPAPQGYGGFAFFGLQPYKASTSYSYVGQERIYTNQIFIMKTDGSGYLEYGTDPAPAANGILQMLDENENVVAATEAISTYSSTYVDVDGTEVRAYYTNQDFTDAADIPAGSYTLQLVAGNTTYPCAGTVEVVGEDCLFISSAYVQNMYEGKEPFDVSMTVFGFETEAELEALSFTLMEGETVVARSTGAYRDINAYSGSEWYLYAEMQVVEGQSIQMGGSYSLTIDYTGEKKLVDGVGSAKGYVSTRYGTVTDLEILDAQNAQVSVSMDYLTANTEYRLVVCDDNDETNVYAEETFTADAAAKTLELQLKKAGSVLPLTGYGGYFYVILYEGESTSSRDEEQFDNPYYNLHEEYVYFFPVSMDPTVTSLPFRIEYHNGCSLYEGAGDVLSMRDAAGNEVGRCDALTLEQQSGNEGVITGTLTVTGTLKQGTYYLYLNGVQFDTVVVTEDLRLTINMPMVNHNTNTFWMNLEQFPAKFTVVNSSGQGQIVFKDGETDVLATPMLTGVSDTGVNTYAYEYVFTAGEFESLTDGAAYTIVFRDGNGVEKTIDNQTFTYTAAKTPLDPANNRHVYFRWYDMAAGEATLAAELYMNQDNGPRNITAADLEVLKNVTASNGTDTFEVTGVSADGWDEDGYRYLMTLTLDKPVTVGNYTAYLDGVQFQTFNIRAAETDPAPEVYDGEAAAGYLRGRYLPVNGVYTAKVYDGYTCLTGEAIPLRLSGAMDGDDQQYLYFDKGVFADYAAGVYTMRVFMGDTILEDVELTVLGETKPLIAVNDEDDVWGDDGDPVIHAREVSIEGTNMGAYGYLRWAETREALAAAKFNPYFSNRYYGQTFEGEDGPRTLYVELSKTGSGDDAENLIYTFDLWLCLAKDYDVQVPENIQGVQNPAGKQYTITATAALPATNLWVSFYDADGAHASQPMSYVGPTEDGRYEFALSFGVNTYDSFYDWASYNGNFYYKDTQSIRVFATDLSDEYNDNEAYEGNIMGTPVDRILVFGDPANVILPQFTKGGVTINRSSYSLYGYASPNSTVTVTEGGTALGAAAANDFGYFTVELTDLPDSRHVLTVADDSGVVGSKDAVLTVDTVAPTVDTVTFTFLADGAAVLHWTCADKDVDYFKVYKNGTYLGEAADNTFSYNVTASENDGNNFTIEAVDLAGNTSSRTVSTADQEPPTAPGTVTVTGVTTTTATLEWTAGTDNIGVLGYDVYVGGEKQNTTAIDGLTYEVTGLEQGTAYTFTVQTRDKAGNSSVDSQPVTAATAALSVTENLQTGYSVISEDGTFDIPLNVIVASDVEAYVPTVKSVTLQYQKPGSAADDWTVGELTTNLGGVKVECVWSVDVDMDSLPAEYNVRLAVTDGEGATAYSETKLVALSEGRVSVTVKDTKTSALIPGAQVSLYQNGKLVTHAVTDVEGVAKLNAPEGTYNMVVRHDGYQARSITSMTVGTAKRDFEIFLSTEDILNVDVTVEEMTYEQIVAAGIDPDAPGNQHVYQATVVLDFELRYYYNEMGEVVKGESVYYDGGVIYPVAKDIFLIVPTQTTWLKEMFDVQLLVTNTSANETIKDCSATLKLPDGLSLADMAEGVQSADVTLGNINPKECATHHWYVRGDAKGEYTLNGTVSATRSSGDFEEPMQVGFTTKDTINVLAGDAMHLTITAEQTAVTGQPYKMRFELQNVSSKPIYNVNFEVFGGTFREAYTIDEVMATYDLEGPFQPDADNSELKNGFALSAQEFKPAEVLSGVFTITFAEGLDKEAELEYMLKQVFLFTGGGSTTVIPTTIELVPSVDDSHTHTYDGGVETTAPTCTENGEMTYTCSVCQDTKVMVIPALGHKMGDWVITAEPTCEGTGTAVSSCTREGCTYSEDKTLGVLGHEFSDERTVDIAPTCTAEGSESRHCIRCDAKTDVLEIPALGHDWSTNNCAQEATCSRCDEIRPAGTHIWGAWTIDAEATCTTEGSRTHACTSCQVLETEKIPMLPHTVVTDEGIAATCTEPGLTEGSHCSVCDTVLVAQEIIPALNHTVVTDEAVAPTCTTAGKTEGSHCSVCGEVLVAQEILDALGHDYESVVTAPTCTADGYTTHTCSRCGDVKVDTYVDALGHDWSTDNCAEEATCSRCDEIRPAGTHIWGDWTVTVAATCTETGSRTRTCTSCGHEETENIVALGHDYVAVVTEPTCLNKGYTTHTCSRCDDSYTDAETAALGHDWGEWIIDKEATETEDGSRHHTCSRCQLTETEVISKWPQQEVSWVPNVNTVTWTYGDRQLVTNTAYNDSEDGSTLVYASSDESVATVDQNGTATILGAGTTIITATAPAVTGKYAETEVSYTLIINKADLTVTANDHTITYGEAPANAGFTASGFVNGEDSSVLTGTAAYTYAYEQLGKAGQYAINVSGLTARNYNVTLESGTLTVNKAANYAITLGNLEQRAGSVEAVTTSIAPQDSTAQISVEYLVDDSWTDDVPQDAGEYNVRAALTASENITAQPGTYTEGTLIVKIGATVDDDISVDVTVEDGKAEITVSDEELDKILDNASGNVSIDLGGVKDTEELVLPGNLIDELSKSDKADGMTITTEDSSITMSDPVLDTVADAMTSGEDKVTVRLTAVEEGDLTPDQQKALNSITTEATIVEVSLIITHPDNSITELHQLGGNVEVTVPYEGEVPAGKYIVVCYLSDDGNVTYVRATYNAAAKQITFNTNHFSHYALFVSGDPAVVVNGGSGSGLYAEGTTVTVKGDEKSGYRFDKWEVASDTTVTLANANAAETTFVMPAGSVELTATYTKISSGGGGGGGGSSTPTYTVTAEKTKNGSVTISPKSAVKGDTVTITVKPDKGYELDTLNVFDKNGDKVKVVEKNGKYTFTMPASKVTVEATFVESKTVDNPFTDVSEDAYYFNPVLWAVENGVTSGTTATTFAPDATCTRAQTVTFLWRAMGSPEPAMTENPFSDVAADAYYYKAVLWAVEQGITTGTTATTFSPNATVTRAQTVTFLWRSAGSPEAAAENPFVDVAAGAYYADAVLWAAEEGITSGTTATTFAPNNNCTRAQIVTFIFRDAEK